MELEQLGVQLIGGRGRAAVLEQAIPLLHLWIRERAGRELLIDVADYRHVPRGADLLVIGDEGHYTLELRDGELAVGYARRRDGLGAVEPKLRQALRRALRLAARLQAAGLFELAPSRKARARLEMTGADAGALVPGEILPGRSGAPQELATTTAVDGASPIGSEQLVRGLQVQVLSRRALGSGAGAKLAAGLRPILDTVLGSEFGIEVSGLPDDRGPATATVGFSRLPTVAELSARVAQAV